MIVRKNKMATALISDCFGSSAILILIKEKTVFSLAKTVKLDLSVTATREFFSRN